jgi:hypothetical protein
MRTVLTPSLGAVLLFGLLATGCSDNESSNENTSNLDASTSSGKSDAQTTGSDTNMSSAIPEKECGSAPKNKGLCVPGTDINCHVKCGPDKIGKRPCVCNPTNSQWECIPCIWDADKDHSCYKKADAPPLCGGGVLPRNNYDCTDKPCSPCSNYKDSNDTVREGFCVCTNGKYSCATSGEWPCGTAKGCI